MIETNYLWINIFLLAVGTITIRISIIALSSKLKISERVKEILTFIPAAILPALIAPAVYFHQGHVKWTFEKERLFVLILATVICYLTRSTLTTIGFGLAVLFLISN